MPVITQGREQHIVGLQTLIAWKRFVAQHEGARIEEYDADRDRLFIEHDGRRFEIRQGRVCV